jgi:hypothetical protein
MPIVNMLEAIFNLSRLVSSATAPAAGRLGVAKGAFTAPASIDDDAVEIEALVSGRVKKLAKAPAPPSTMRPIAD